MSDKSLTHKYHQHLKSISGHFTDTFILRKYKSEKKPRMDYDIFRNFILMT